jgi:predicted Zn-dependent protease
MAIVVWLMREKIEDAIAELIPAGIEEQLGRATMTQLAVPTQLCSSEPIKRPVDEIVERLSGALNRNEYTFRVSILDDPTVNAFAVPGGYIVLFRGLVERTESPDELAGVLAHEMQHVTQRHSLKGMIRAAGIVSLLSLITGDTSAIAAAAGQLTHLSFQRADEEDADREGMRVLQRARLDAAGMVHMYQKLGQEAPDIVGPARYLSTHPQTADRVEKLKILSAEARYQPVPVRSARTWSEVKKLCR